MVWTSGATEVLKGFVSGSQIDSFFEIRGLPYTLHFKLKTKTTVPTYRTIVPYFRARTIFHPEGSSFFEPLVANFVLE